MAELDHEEYQFSTTLTASFTIHATDVGIVDYEYNQHKMNNDEVYLISLDDLFDMTLYLFCNYLIEYYCFYVLKTTASSSVLPSDAGKLRKAYIILYERYVFWMKSQSDPVRHHFVHKYFQTTFPKTVPLGGSRSKFGRKHSKQMQHVVYQVCMAVLWKPTTNLYKVKTEKAVNFTWYKSSPILKKQCYNMK
ncbi:hypothetical protein STEG23_007778 [Scotinomys teguina]